MALREKKRHFYSHVGIKFLLLISLRYLILGQMNFKKIPRFYYTLSICKEWKYILLIVFPDKAYSVMVAKFDKSTAAEGFP